MNIRNFSNIFVLGKNNLFVKKMCQKFEKMHKRITPNSLESVLCEPVGWNVWNETKCRISTSNLLTLTKSEANDCPSNINVFPIKVPGHGLKSGGPWPSYNINHFCYNLFINKSMNQTETKDA